MTQETSGNHHLWTSWVMTFLNFQSSATIKNLHNSPDPSLPMRRTTWTSRKLSCGSNPTCTTTSHHLRRSPNGRLFGVVIGRRQYTSGLNLDWKQDLHKKNGGHSDPYEHLKFSSFYGYPVMAIYGDESGPTQTFRWGLGWTSPQLMKRNPFHIHTGPVAVVCCFNVLRDDIHRKPCFFFHCFYSFFIIKSYRRIS